MRLAVLVAILGASAPRVEAAQARRPVAPSAQQAADPSAEAYGLFLHAHLIEDDDVEGAIAAYKRAITLDPRAATLPADLASLYLRENRVNEAMQAAEQALKLAPTHYEAHRVLGTAYATLASGAPGQRGGRGPQDENLAKAVEHLEQAIEPPMAAADANLRATLARLYVATSQYDKAIPILADLVIQEPAWQEGPGLLTEAYAAAGRSSEAIAWLEEAAPDNPQLFATLGDFYARNRRFADAATAYEQALKATGSTRSFDLRVRVGESLLNSGSQADVARARDVLREAVSMRGTDERALYLLAVSERASGDSAAAESVARRLIAQNARNPRGYTALAEALEDQRRFQALVDVLAPALPTFRGGTGGNLGLRMLLPHLGFAYQELGQFDKAITTFEEARKIAPNEASFVGFLIQAQMAAKRYTEAGELAHAARQQNPDNLGLARLESQALQRGGKVDLGLAVLEEFVRKPGSDADAYRALAQAYSEANRPAQAVKVLQDAQTKFPSDTSIVFELGATLDKQKKFAESEAVFRQLIAKEPDNAPALNYLGYMLADRGERLGESVDYLKRALAIDPENGSYLDSIGWAYFKDGKLQLAVENLRRAAVQLQRNSIVQDHYGEVLFKLGRYDDAIEAWNRALSGDLDSVDRSDLDKKIRSARQKLPKR